MQSLFQLILVLEVVVAGSCEVVQDSALADLRHVQSIPYLITYILKVKKARLVENVVSTVDKSHLDVDVLEGFVSIMLLASNIMP